MDILSSLLAWLASAAGAAINAVAGGGTFLTFPLLTFLGMGALQANIVSTIALWPGVAASCFAYRHEWKEVKHQLSALMIVSVLGSAVGALILLSTPEKQFAALVPWLLLGATLVLTFGPNLARYKSSFGPGFRRGKLRPGSYPSSTPLPAEREDPGLRRDDASPATGNRHPASLSELRRTGPTTLFLQFLIAFYGGYFGAGIGILMLAVLQFYPLRDIHQQNAVKTVLGTSINAVAFVIFLFSGLVVWEVAALMLTGGIVGGYLGARLALKIPPRLMRRFIMAVAWVMTISFFVASG